ncbi:Retrovirus-related Pol polyprotein from transposon TNT 1-94 [Gossypium australe]|uniref:Retrovirus-related Pol polyprotein from transposon TNT 1-94 n=1 Tax=Gossypium australe TaxID=47621 RepID=A0A5B6VW76_9ROSI|nr:Retrovirus-related Pol polyprotein from transposon TNT 1-94 [Gossypium australe]
MEWLSASISTSLKWASRQSSFKVLYGHDPTYDHLRVFDCCCFPYLRPFVTYKLEFRPQPSTFLGYSTQHKGYQCLLPNDTVIISRHVVFDENRFLSSESALEGSILMSSTTVSMVVSLIWQISSRPIEVSTVPPTPSQANISSVSSGVAGIFKPRVLAVETVELSTIEEAMSTSEWRATAQAEYDALIHNSTWELVPLPPNRRVIGC